MKGKNGIPISDYQFDLEHRFDEMTHPSDVQGQRDARIQTLTRIGSKYEFQDFRVAVKAINEDDGWPTAGQFNLMLKDAAEARIKAASKKDIGGITDFRPIMGYCFDEIMHSREGQRARARGQPHTFLRDVVERKIAIESLRMIV